MSETPGSVIAGLRIDLARVELDRDEWKDAALAARAQQRDAMARERQVLARLASAEAACRAHVDLMDDDVPSNMDTVGYQEGASRAALAIHEALSTGETAPARATVTAGNGDDLDVAAGRCCPICRNSLAEHNRSVWNAGYSIGQRHAGGAQ